MPKSSSSLLLTIPISILLLFLLASSSSGAEQDTLTNIGNLPARKSAQIPFIQQGYVVVLPGGRQAVVEEALPDNRFRINTGQILSAQGIILEGDDAGQAVTIDTDYAREHKIEMTSVQHDTFNSQTSSQNIGEKNRSGTTPAPQSPVVAEVEPTAPVAIPGAPQAPVVISPSPALPANPGVAGTPAQSGNQPQDAGQLTLAELLPMTTIATETPAQQNPEKKPRHIKIEPQKQPTHKEPEPAKKTQPAKKAEKPIAAEKPEPKSPPKATPKPAQKAKVGEELRIPPESIKTGNLDFLEGCWQGTRPEYYTKRTVRECFCFGANGKNGKRRLYDPSYRRQCIGASRAHLSSGGVLSVTSEGAVCTDGERWGQAEMVCRNSGPKTPCSWVFRDANNGRQSYEIPFIRVESCGK